MELKEAKEFLKSKGYILEESKQEYKTLIDKNVITDWETFGKNAFDYLDDKTVEKILSIYSKEDPEEYQRDHDLEMLNDIKSNEIEIE